MLHLYQDDVTAFGRFISENPQAAAATHQWAAQQPSAPLNKQHLALFEQSCAEKHLPASQLKMDLGTPTTTAAIIKGLVNLTKTDKYGSPFHDRLTIIAATLSTAVSPEETFSAL